MKSDKSDMVIMGRIVAPYGVLGWLKVLPDTEVIDGLFDYPVWWIGKDDSWREINVLNAKVHNDVLLAKLNGINDRDAAFACKGQLIAVPRADLPEPDEGEYYWSDLIGLTVKNKQGADFGLITNVFQTGANDVLVVNTGSEAGNIERLIPFIDQVIVEVDTTNKTMLVDWDADF